MCVAEFALLVHYRIQHIPEEMCEYLQKKHCTWIHIFLLISAGSGSVLVNVPCSLQGASISLVASYEAGNTVCRP
jgi:hypothetical protein